MKVDIVGRGGRRESVEYLPTKTESLLETCLQERGLVLAHPSSIEGTVNFFENPFVKRKAGQGNAEVAYERWFNEKSIMAYWQRNRFTVPAGVLADISQNAERFYEVIFFSISYLGGQGASYSIGKCSEANEAFCSVHLDKDGNITDFDIHDDKKNSTGYATGIANCLQVKLHGEIEEAGIRKKINASLKLIDKVTIESLLDYHLGLGK